MKILKKIASFYRNFENFLFPPPRIYAYSFYLGEVVYPRGQNIPLTIKAIRFGNPIQYTCIYKSGDKLVDITLPGCVLTKAFSEE